MKKMIKKLISSCVGFMIILSCFILMPQIAYAGDREKATTQEFLEYANAAKGKYYQAGLCLKFVSDFFADGYNDIAGMGFPLASSLTSAHYCYYHHVERHDGDWNIPVGADVFFDGWGNVWNDETNQFEWVEVGHVGIYMGDDLMLHAYDGEVIVSSVSEHKTYYYNGSAGVQYLGWAWHPYVTIESENANLGDDFYANIAAAGNDQWIFLENNGGNVQLCEKKNDYTDTRQQWHFIRQQDGSYRIINLYDGRYLNADAMGSAGYNISTYSYLDWEGQCWYIIRTGNWYSIVPKYNTKICIDVEGTKIKCGTNIQLWDYGGNPAQVFDIYKYDLQKYPITSNLGDDFYATIAASGNDQWIFLENNGGNVQLCETKNDYTNSRQQWHFIRQQDGSYRIINLYDGRYLNADAMGSAGYNVSTYSYLDWEGQYWYAIKTGNWYSIVPKYNMKICLDVEGTKLKCGTNIQLWDYGGNAAQLFDVYKNDIYPVIYNANEGTGAPEKQIKVKGTALRLSSVTPTRTGYAFRGWATSANAATPTYQPGDTYSRDANLTLYAVWEPVTYTVYNSPYTKGSGQSVYITPINNTFITYTYTTTSSYSNAVTISASNYSIQPERLTFNAAWLDSLNAGTCYLWGVPGTGAPTYLGYMQINNREYTITYDANGGTDAPASQTKIHDRALTLSSDKPRHEDSSGSYKVRFKIVSGSTTTYTQAVNVRWRTTYTFKSWNTDKNGYGTSYAPGALYTANDSATLYAMWSSNKTTESVPLPNPPARSDYVFTGWATRSDASFGVFSYTPTRDGDVTLYATWKKMDCILPEALTEIESEAFDGCAFSSVKLSDNTTTIGRLAFVDCPNLKYIYIPAATKNIDRYAFAGVEGLTILGPKGSYAETYAQENGFAFHIAV